MSTFPLSPFGTQITAEEIVETMQGMRGWEDRYRQVIQWGKKLPVMPEEFKSQQVTVSGCESQVWLVSEQVGETWSFCADSDARIVRG
ncbi:cysteine desulfurase CsdA-CsdE [Vibrio ponticus]|nr:cysteine desulfurase CsdA-CsdE [Vibrio ponticus]